MTPTTAPTGNRSITPTTTPTGNRSITPTAAGLQAIEVLHQQQQ